MTHKQFTQFVKKIEQLPLPELEKLIKKFYRTYLEQCVRGNDRLVTEKIKLGLRERKRRLNQEFVFSPENVNCIRQINDHLILATQQLLYKTREINQQMRKLLNSADDFLHEFSIEASLTVNWENSGNLMLEILDEFSWEALRHYFTNSSSNNPIDSDMDEGNWNEEELAGNELSSIPYLPYAAHSLFCHLSYSFSDCMTIESFRSEIVVKWINVRKVANKP